MPEAEPKRYIKPDAPLYLLTEPAYIDDKLFPEGAQIHYAGVPGYHMEAVDDAAKAMKKKHPSVKSDPIAEMTLINGAADESVVQLTKALQLALKGAVAA